MRRIVSLFLMMLAAELGIWGLARAGYFYQDSRVLGDATGTVESRIAALESRVYRLEKTTGLVKTYTTAATTKEFFVTLNGGSAEGYDWTKLSGSDFTFDLSLYGVATVTWEGWMENGMGSVRIYDDTNHRAVDGSEIMVISGSKSSFYSKNLSIWRGHNQYHLEIKSLSGRVIVTSPRLKILGK